MSLFFRFPLATLCALGCLVSAPAQEQTTAGTIGIFQDHQDVGTPSHAGSVDYNPADGTYKITGGGTNMWFANDSFHYVWVKVSGDLSLAADIAFVGKGVDPHRKACLMIRQSLDADSAYADAALHGVGLTSLQFRESKGDATHEIQSNVSGPKRLRVEKRGNYVTMSIAAAGEDLHPSGASFRITFTEPFYIGLGVCAHNSGAAERNHASEQAIFSNVELKEGAQPALRTMSTLETIAIASTDRKVVYCTSNHIEAPNWSHDGTYFLFNSRGHIYRLPVAGGEPQLVDTGFAHQCNNDHGISPDGTQLAISDSSRGGKSLVYVLPVTGGTPTRITPTGPSYWHGWSPDGTTLAFCGQRNGEFDVYTIPVAGGPETRLTTAPGKDDGPEYSPDGDFIYFNSERTGQMQIWRMHPDGTQQEQVTSDEYNNWFAHISPNGRTIVLLSYEKGVTDHPAGKDVLLRTMPVAGGNLKVLAKLFGGQGTINVPSWSPDSRNVAFVSYSPP
jgi:Tol biopolymer transport system component